MAENVNFIQGRKEQYNPSEMQGGLFFSKDSKEILLNGDSYGNATPADEEDITAESGNLKLKDRAYDEANFSGKGYKILRKNIQGEKNILTQDMINEPNTVYEIRYDFDLNGQEITIPEGCVLDFQGGSFNNGTIIASNTNIIANEYQIFTKVLLKGTFNRDLRFLDIWHNNIFDESLNSLSKLVLTKTHYIEEGDSYIFHRITSQTLSIDGNYNQIVFQSDGFSEKRIFVECENIVLSNVTFLVESQNVTAKIGTIFNSRKAELYNVHYKGYNRFICNWTWTDLDEDTGLKIINCQLYSTSFLFENNFSEVLIVSSVLSVIDGTTTEYQYKLLSIAGSKSDKSAAITILDSDLFGGIELVDNLSGSEEYNYSKITIKNSTLRAFTISSYTTIRADADLITEYYNCVITLYLTNNHVNSVGHARYYFCNFIYDQSINIYNEFPFTIISLKELKFIGCTFYINDISVLKRVDIIMFSTLFGDNIIKIIFLGCKFIVAAEYFSGEINLINATNAPTITTDYIKTNFKIVGNKIECIDNALPYIYLKAALASNQYVILPSDSIKLDGIQGFKNYDLLNDESVIVPFAIDASTNQVGYYKNGIKPFIEQSYGDSDSRPVFINGRNKGFQYFDTTLNKAIWWNGYKWIDPTENISWALVE